MIVVILTSILVILYMLVVKINIYT